MSVATEQQPASSSSPTSPQRPRAEVKDVNPQTKTTLQWVSQILSIVAVAALAFGLYLVAVTPIQHRTAQNELYHDLRYGLANASLPMGPFSFPQSDPHNPLPDDAKLEPTAVGVPLALMTIPKLDLSEVIVEGTSATQTARGVGHKRDTVLPGQNGTSVVMGRAGAFGGPLSGAKNLTPGDVISFITQQGEFTYRVTGIRRAGDPGLERRPADVGRLTLMTADGAPFLPRDLLRVDAELVGKPVGAEGKVKIGTIPDNENAMAGQSGATWISLIFLLQGLTIALICAVWCHRNWGKQQTWIVFTPVLLALSLLAFQQIAYLLPNVL